VLVEVERQLVEVVMRTQLVVVVMRTQLVVVVVVMMSLVDRLHHHFEFFQVVQDHWDPLLFHYLLYSIVQVLHLFERPI
jgi:hypothetical protein